jgi:hypothetical protein
MPDNVRVPRLHSYQKLDGSFVSIADPGILPVPSTLRISRQHDRQATAREDGSGRQPDQSEAVLPPIQF